MRSPSLSPPLSPPLSQLIRTPADVEVHLSALLAKDHRLVPLAERCGQVPLRILGAGFAGLTQIIVGQLLSVAAARAIHQRLVGHLVEVTPQSMLQAEDEELRALGLSHAKIKGLKAVATLIDEGQFELEQLGSLPADQALAALMGLPGVGRWTAEIYLISGIGHADIFPAGDLALRKVVGIVIGRDEVPDEKQVRKIAQNWAPHRAVAARLLWRYFAVLRDREGINL